jgi:hypothetical protein
VLLEAGADPLGITEGRNRPVLDFAAIRSSPAVLDCFMQHGSKQLTAGVMLDAAVMAHSMC